MGNKFHTAALDALFRREWREKNKKSLPIFGAYGETLQMFLRYSLLDANKQRHVRSYDYMVSLN